MRNELSDEDAINFFYSLYKTTAFSMVPLLTPKKQVAYSNWGNVGVNLHVEYL